jgi:hypothetical protein
MAQNVGTLVSAAIRPNDSLDLIASAFASEIKGGLHSVTTTSDRNNIIFQRREWGMMCYVTNDNKTYQLTYGYVNTDIMNNSNWKEFSGSGGSGSGGGTEWIDSVLSVQTFEPAFPVNGNRYLMGLDTSTPLTGTTWSTFTASQVAQWNSTLSKWDLTVPTVGMSVRVDNEDNSIYRYEGNFPTGFWVKDKLGQIRNLTATTTNGYTYVATTTPPLDDIYQDLIFLVKFSSQNLGTTASININSMGVRNIKRVTPSGVIDLAPSDIQPNVVYTMVYDGTDFQINRPYVNEDLFNVKYNIEYSDYIMVPPYYQYWVYSDLKISGTLVNYGQVVIANGSMILSGGTFSNFGSLSFVSFNAGLTTSFNDSETIDFSSENTIFGLSVSAVVKDMSLTASKLDTGSNGGATAGYLLSVDNSGKFNWVNPGSLEQTDKNYLMTFDTSGNGQFVGLTISNTPLPGGYVGVFVNGQEFQVGIGLTNGVPFYFSNDGGSTGKSVIEIGDSLYWNGDFVGMDLYTGWRISLYYIT